MTNHEVFMMGIDKTEQKALLLLTGKFLLGGILLAAVILYLIN